MSLSALKNKQANTQQNLLSESHCWLENLSRPMLALCKCALSAVWHTCLGIALFYDAYHTMNNVGLESIGKDEHHLESWDHVLVLQGMLFQALPYAMRHVSQWRGGKRRLKLALISTQHLGSLGMTCALRTEEKYNRNEWYRWSEVTRLRDGMPKTVMRAQSVTDH